MNGGGMKRAIAILCLLAFITAIVSAQAPRPTPEPSLFSSPVPLENPVFLPFVGKNAVTTPPPPVTEICNPSAEQGETCWTFSYPNSGNVLCGCDGEECPEPVDGDCLFRFAGWHDMVETGQTADFWLDAQLVYALLIPLQVWSDEWSLDDEDTLDIYLVVPGGYHHHLLDASNLAEQGWRALDISISPGVTGYYSLLFVAITDEEKEGPWPGRTNFYIDDLRLYEWGGCKECVVCQLLDQPPETFCDQGHEDDCDDCCPSGDDCAGLDPQCPVLPPPHFYRELDRWATCYETQALTIANGNVGDLRPPERRRP